MNKVSEEHKKEVRRAISARTREMHKALLEKIGLNSTEGLMGVVKNMNARQLRALKNLIESVSMPGPKKKVKKGL